MAVADQEQVARHPLRWLTIAHPRIVPRGYDTRRCDTRSGVDLWCGLGGVRSVAGSVALWFCALRGTSVSRWARSSGAAGLVEEVSKILGVWGFRLRVGGVHMFV